MYNYDEVRRWTTEKKLKRMGQASASVLDCDRVVIPVRFRHEAVMRRTQRKCLSLPDALDTEAYGRNQRVKCAAGSRPCPWLQPLRIACLPCIPKPTCVQQRCM